VFNVADVALVIGVGIMLFVSGDDKKAKAAKKKPAASSD
jgi:lipoprotein signal peptidase